MSTNTSTRTTLSYINKAILQQRTFAAMDDMKYKGDNRFITGRRVSPSHYFSMMMLIELAYVEYKKTKQAFLRTNRGNLAHAFRCCKRTTYNYILDFELSGFIEVEYEDIRTTNELGFIEERTDVIIRFSNSLIIDRIGDNDEVEGDQKSDTKQAVPSPASPLLGKVCRIHNSILHIELKNNLNNSRFTSAKNVENRTGKAITDPFRQEKYALRKRVYKSDSDQKELEENANLIWRQAFHIFWGNPMWKSENEPKTTFSHSVQAKCVEYISVALVERVRYYTRERNRILDELKNNPAFISQNKWKQKSMVRKKTNSLPLQLRNPHRGAYLDLNRALTIQAENCEKKGYKLYFPLVYFSEYFDRAIGYALKEHRTLAKHDCKNELRMQHTEAKNRLMRYADEAARKIRGNQANEPFALQQMRERYMEFHNFLCDTKIEDKQVYLDRFIKQVVAIIQP